MLRRWLRENRGFLLFLVCLGFLRTAVADWNPIPSGSMRPTLLEGDVVLVDRLAYDFKLPLTGVSLRRMGEPRRGDVVTFRHPHTGERMIKRLVGLPGDVIELRNEQLLVNDVAAAYGEFRVVEEPLGEGAVQAWRATERTGDGERSVQFLPAIPARRSFGPVTVPPDRYFFLGDNRDNSADSRYIGAVPRELLIGRAHRIVASAAITGNWLPRWELPRRGAMKRGAAGQAGESCENRPGPLRPASARSSVG